MEDEERDALRRLALWLSRRRAVDEALDLLTASGPAACQQVHGHLDALRTLLAAEHAAFAAVERNAPVVPQYPLPTLLEAPVRPAATVHVLGAARDRHSG